MKNIIIGIATLTTAYAFGKGVERKYQDDPITMYCVSSIGGFIIGFIGYAVRKVTK